MHSGPEKCFRETTSGYLNPFCAWSDVRGLVVTGVRWGESDRLEVALLVDRRQMRTIAEAVLIRGQIITSSTNG